MAEPNEGLREIVERRSGTELIKELVKAIPLSDKEDLESMLSKLDIDKLIDAVAEIRRANYTRKPITAVSLVPSGVYNILGLCEVQGVAATVTTQNADMPSEIIQGASGGVHENSVRYTSKTDANMPTDISQMMLVMMAQMQKDSQRMAERQMDLEKRREGDMMELIRSQEKNTCKLIESLVGTSNQQEMGIRRDNPGPPKDHLAKEISKVLGLMPERVEKIPDYFEVLEAYLNQKQVQKESWLGILRGVIGFHGNKVAMTLPLFGSRYEEVKEAIFSHYGISANLYYDKFHDMRKPHYMTYKAFTETMCDNLKKYLEFSKVEQTYEALFDKIVHDRLRTVLPDKLIELANQWEFKEKMDARELARFADQMSVENNIHKQSDGKTERKFCTICKKTNHFTAEHRDRPKPSAEMNAEPTKLRTFNNSGTKIQVPGGGYMNKDEWEEKCKKEGLCLGCGYKYDKAHKNCSKRSQYMNQNKGGFWYENNSDRGERDKYNHDRKKVQRITMQLPSIEVTSNESRGKDHNKMTDYVECKHTDINHGNLDRSSEQKADDCGVSIQGDSSTHLAVNIKDCTSAGIEASRVNLPTSGDVTLVIDGIKITGIVDTGAEISIIKTDALPSSKLHDNVPKLVLQGPFGETRRAKLQTLSCTLINPNTSMQCPIPIPITFAICDDLMTEKLLLSSQDYNTLREAYIEAINNRLINTHNCNEIVRYDLPDIECTCICKPSTILSTCDRCQYLRLLPTADSMTADSTGNYQDNVDDSINTFLFDFKDIEVEESRKGIKSVTVESKLQKSTDSGDNLARQDSSEADLDTLLREQEQDKDLKPIRGLACKGDKAFFKHEATGLFYRRSYLRGILREQLVLPDTRRLRVLEQAHDKLFGGHFSDKKTRAKIETYFWWPSIARDTKNYTRSCEICQRKRVATVGDKIPIKFMPRGTQAFDILVADVIGPLDESSQHHKWCLTVVDLYSRFPFIFPIKSLKPQEVCQCFVQIFCTFGVPSKIITDMGTNFCSELNADFAKVFGFMHSLCTPGRKEATGLAERHNANIEKMLHQVLISNNKRNWANLCPLMAWGLRDTVNETTGLTPFELVFGHNARSPMALLKDNWGQENYHSLKKPYKEYMYELSRNLAAVAEMAELNCNVTQQRYQDTRNEGTKQKTFEVGEKVVVLIPNSTYKIRSQWGLGTVLEKMERDSYRIQMDETGQIRVLHADKMRHFYSRVQHLGVMIQHESDFMTTGLDSAHSSVIADEVAVSSSERVDLLQQIDLSHLSSVERDQLLCVLYKHRKLFTGETGMCNVCEHTIDVTPDFHPKQFATYRFPQKLISDIEEKLLTMEREIGRAHV